MKVIGITGRSGSGKSTLSAAIGRLGAVVLDGDETAASLLKQGSPLLKQVIEAFGGRFELPDGSLDRPGLGAHVFSDERELLRLNEIVHPAFKQEIKRSLERLKAKAAAPEFAVIDAAVLFEAGIDGLCDLVVAVFCEDEAAAMRISKRDGIGTEGALQRIRAQRMRMGDYLMSRKSDVTVISRGDPREMDRWAERLLRIARRATNG